jgi:FkbM family methyltransferase
LSAFHGFYKVDLFDCPPFQMFTVGDDTRAFELIVRKRFEPHSMQLWCKYARSATSIVDIGAHTGIYALAAAALRRDIPIYAFEPNPYTAARLRVHRMINGFGNLIDYAVALSDVTGVTEIGWSAKQADMLSSSSRIGSFGDNYGSNKAAVYTLPLDFFAITQGPRPLVKMDVEGAELAVFRGMAHFLKARPTIILETFDQGSCDAITEMLPNYEFFLIHENGDLKPQAKLIAANRKTEDLNQLCLPR